ncbi:MAG TPA: hypothetical protein VL984_17790 [Acidimicrobiales bacterium]|nr:hypothetical protein [Acidimicrobiales bacterium]
MSDALELELRQLAGVSFVSFAETEGISYIELVVSEGTDHAKVREEAARSAVNHLETPAEIRVFGPPPLERAEPSSEGRIRLLVVLPSDGGASIEVQLSRGAQRSASKAVAGDTAAVGRAVLEALRGLGIVLPFEVVSFHALPSDWGAGLLAVLRENTTGQLRRGVASGRSPADAAARAVLNALNRSL